ncbi:MAG TPA: bacteriohemerythrin [Longilinea sp.]|nr:bacteriohemerythrin [Longilinea sp.]
MIVWDESLSTGVTMIDEQHKMLFQSFNEFSEALTKVTAREAAGEVLDFLQFYAVWHFKEEEKEMEAANCPAADENKRAHAEFIEIFTRFYTQWQEGIMTLDLAAQSYQQLEKWLVDHVLRVDTQLRTAVKQ